MSRCSRPYVCACWNSLATSLKEQTSQPTNHQSNESNYVPEAHAPVSRSEDMPLNKDVHDDMSGDETVYADTARLSGDDFERTAVADDMRICTPITAADEIDKSKEVDKDTSFEGPAISQPAETGKIDDPATSVEAEPLLSSDDYAQAPSSIYTSPSADAAIVEVKGEESQLLGLIRCEDSDDEVSSDEDDEITKLRDQVERVSLTPDNLVPPEIESDEVLVAKTATHKSIVGDLLFLVDLYRTSVCYEVLELARLVHAYIQDWIDRCLNQDSFIIALQNLYHHPIADNRSFLNLFGTALCNVSTLIEMDHPITRVLENGNPSLAFVFEKLSARAKVTIADLSTPKCLFKHSRYQAELSTRCPLAGLMNTVHNVDTC